MKKKLFSLMMTLVLAFMGVAQAQVSLPFEEGFESSIMTGWTYSNCHSSTGQMPGSYYCHSGNGAFRFYYTTNPPQYLISPELAAGGAAINVEFYYKSYSDYYGLETFKVGYSSTSNAVGDFTFGSEITAPTSWTLFSETAPAGTKYVAIQCTSYDVFYLLIDDFVATSAGGGGGGGGTAEEQLHIKYMVGTDTYMIDTLDLGVRPANAWMAPFEFTMYSEGPAYQVNLLDFTPSDGLFSVSGQELPFAVRVGEDVTLGMSTNGTAAGVIERQFVAITELIREAHVWPIKVELYEPDIPDVWEMACTDAPTNVPYSMAFTEKPATDHGTTLHNDYTLPFPDVPEGVDAVYKLVYTKDVVLNASVISGADGKVALYAEDFNGEGGPMAENYYYGPTLASGRVNRENMTFDFEDGALPAGWTYEGDATWTVGTGDYSTSTGAHSGTYNAKCTHSSRGDETYLVTNPMDFSGVTSGTINCYFVNRPWTGDIDEFGVYYRTNGGAWHQLYHTTESHATWTEMGEIALAGFGANYQIGFLMVDDWGYGVGLDDITITTNGGGGGGFTPGEGGMAPITYEYGPVISDMPVEAGTYYLVASSTDADFEVSIDAALMPCPSMVENEVFSFSPSPADNADGIQPNNVTVSWTVPTYATEWRIILGSTYYPELNHPYTQYYPNNNGEWGWSTDLASSYTFPRALFQNTNYFWRVEFRNNGECTDGVSSPVWGFTTTFRVPQNLTVEDENLFTDEQVHLSWDPVVDRTYRRYFIYRDGVKVGETTEHDINATSFTDGPLAYNMAGYAYTVTAVYDEGESDPSDPVIVKVSGYGNVAGYVYEQDETTGIVGATVTMEGEDEFGDPHTYTFTTGAGGAYSGQVYAGVYNGSAACAGYQPVDSPYIGGNPIAINYNATTEPVNYKMDENFYGPCDVVAQYYPDSTDVNSEYVKVYWGCGLPVAGIFEPFETGDFGQYDWQMDASHPWTIDNTHAYEGDYCMKSGAAGIANGVSTMSVTVNIPGNGIMSFYGKISSEANYDKGYFYIDGVQKGVYSGNGAWTEEVFEITSGEHLFTWKYQKDGSLNSNDDCFYVDDITFFRQADTRETAFQSDDRALSHYRVYRTNCYQDAPYTEENTVLLATVWVPDTVYIDVEWADLEPGVYKWGVGAVYVGNRDQEVESPITWSKPVEVATEMRNREEVYDFEDGNIPAGWVNDATYPWTVVTNAMDHSGHCMKCGNTGIANSTSSISATVNYTDAGTVSFLAGIWGEGSNDSYDWDKCRFYIDGEMVMDYGSHQAWEGMNFNVPAGDHTFTWTYKKDGSVNPVGDAFFVDNVRFAVNGGGGGEGGGTYAAGTDPIQEERESVIAWSNCLDKDMYMSNVDINVLLNSADPSDGVTISLTNLNEIEQGLYPMDDVVLDSSAFYAWESFRRGDYAIHIEKEGYYDIDTTMSIWSETHMRFVMIEILYPVSNIYVSRTGWAQWDGIDIPVGPEPGPEPGPGTEAINEGFEGLADNALPTGWTSIDADGDGYEWYTLDQVANSLDYNNSHDGGTGWATSASYQSAILHPDNYLVSPQVALGGTFSFWANAQDASYPAEKFGVAVSTTGNTNAADFTTLESWTLTAKSLGVKTSDTRSRNRVSGAYYQYTVDLSAYAGQTGYVAIRHYDCFDQFRLNVDDIVLTAPSAKNGNETRHLEHYKIMCTSIDGVPIFNHDTPADQPFCQLTTVDPNNGNDVLIEGEHYLVKVACVYSSGMSEWSAPVEWVYEPCEHWGPVDEVEVTTGTEGNHIEWVFDHSYNPYSLDLGRSNSNQSNETNGANFLTKYANAPVYRQYADDGLLLNFLGISDVYFRTYLLYTLYKDGQFTLVPDNEYGQFIVTPAHEMSNFMEAFELTYKDAATDYSLMSKMDITDQSGVWKSSVAPTDYLSIMMDVMTATSRADNDHCINSMPFCTTEAIEFPAAHEGGATADENANFGCVSSQPYPSWYHMRIREAGPFVIHMEALDPDNPSANRDIDYCIWGPFDDPYEPCLNDLTCDKIIDCSYSAASVEDVYLGYPVSEHVSHHGSTLADGSCINYHVPQVGEYYILMITNFSQQQCNISFTKTEGVGETDCELVAPSDALGFLITMDGEFLTFVMNPNLREYTHVGEFGDHEYCVRPIYPGLQELPEHNYYFSMGCPVCQNTGGELTCAPGDPIHVEELGATDQVKIWWGEETPGPGPGGDADTFTVDFDGGMPAGWTTIDSDGDGYGWVLGSACNGIYLSGGDLTGAGHNSSTDLMTSGSYSNVVGALTPDNYLVSPQVTLAAGSTFSFWACAQDASYAAERFGVFVSDNGTSDWTSVQEWTMTAKSANSGVMSFGRSGNTRAQGSWYQYTVDLSAYAGDKYIAIRHFDCTDMFLLNVDDIELSAGAKSNRATIEQYNVYRADEAEGTYVLIGEVPYVAEQTYYEYIDTPEAAGTYYYKVTALYSNSCESEGAPSFADPTVNFVVAEVTGMGENNDKVVLYPNPTKGNVTIEANGMSRISVVSVLGQVVYDTEVNASSYTLNMSQFNAGMYMVRVYTENGVTIKRVTVMQ